MEYRREIDGLRALAVVPVILQHAKFSLTPGGYVGVDIFFVISGFLISSIIYADAIKGSFSLGQFYERRARRIIPALVTMALCTTAAAYFLMLPDSYENYGQSLFATLLFSNNILLTLTSGYWSLASEFKPLLHTWSLGLEEQFYIAYPLLVVVLLRKRLPFAAVLGTLTVASFVLSVTLSRRQPNASFYLLHTRAWELLFGALAAYYVDQRNRIHGNGYLAASGLLLILASIFFIQPDIPYPYTYALSPCAGTALILVFGRRDTLVGRLLSSPIMVGLGLVSYSAYLWHQPLFALARLTRVSEPPMSVYALLTIATFVLAYLSWRYIEKPFRSPILISKRQIFALSGATSLALASVGLGIALTRGLPGRVAGLGVGQSSYIAYNESAYRFKRDTFRSSSSKRLLVLGNSTARDFINIAIESKRFSDLDIVYRDDLDLCKPLDTPLHRRLVEAADAIIVAASWRFAGMCQQFPLEKAPLRNKPLVLVGLKHFGYNLDAYISTPLLKRPKLRAILLPSSFTDNERFRRMVPSGHYVDVIEILKRRYGGVPVFDDGGRILSIDRVHLTEAGARFLAKVVFDDPAWASLGLTLDQKLTQYGSHSDRTDLGRSFGQP